MSHCMWYESEILKFPPYIKGIYKTISHSHRHDYPYIIVLSCNKIDAVHNSNICV